MAKKRRKMTKAQMRKKRRRKLLVAEIVILFALLITLFVWNKIGMISWDDLGSIGTNELSDETEELLEGFTTFAIFGVDNRKVGKYESGNSDSIIICAIDNDTKEAKLMSVYRDSYLDIGNGSFQKCNAAYSKGGPEKSLEMLNKNLDLNIQNYVAIDFKAVVDAVNAVGGIEIDVTDEEAEVLNTYLPEIQNIMGYNTLPVSGGYQTLDGMQALSYCRIRYTEGDDFRRAERQRTVLSLLVDKAKNANIVQLNDLINAIFPEISTSLSLTQCLSMAAEMSDYEISASQGWPVDIKTKNMGKKGDVVVPCTLGNNVSRAHEFLYKEYDYEPTAEVKALSSQIQTETGYSAADALNYITWE